MLPLNIRELDSAILPNTGDDLTDRIHTALEKAKYTKRWVYFPAGVYNVSGTILELRLGQRVNLCGDSRFDTIFRVTSGADVHPVIEVSGSPGQQHGGFKMKGLRFEALIDASHNVDRPSCSWLDLSYSSYVDLEDVMFWGNDGYALWMKSCWDHTYTNVHFAKSGSNTAAVVNIEDSKERTWVDYSNNIVFDKCRFEDNFNWSIYFGRRARKCRVNNCKFDRNKRSQIVFSEADSCYVGAGTHITKANESGILIAGSQGITVSDTFIEGCGRYAVEVLNKSKYCTVTNLVCNASHRLPGHKDFPNKLGLVVVEHGCLYSFVNNIQAQ